MLDDRRQTVSDRIGDLGGAVVTVDGEARAIAGVEVVLGCRSNGVARELLGNGGALHRHARLANLEAELALEAERARVVGGLEQPHTGETCATLEHPTHERSTDPRVLDRRVDRDRPDAGDRRPLVQEAAADDPALQLGDAP
jgi:hypothetical protein